jgi:isocitrate lyase
MKDQRLRALRSARLTGGQAVQMVKAGLEAIYLSGWQVAADANTSAQTYPDQSLYPADSVPKLVKRINNALQPRRPDRQRRPKAAPSDWFAPIVADAEAGFGGPLNSVRADEVHDRGRRGRRALRGPAGLGEEVRSPGRQGPGPHGQFTRSLIAARLAADVAGVPTLLVARTDADSPSCSPATSTIATSRSAPVSAPPRASTASSRARERHRARQRLRALRRLFWWRPARRTWRGAPTFAEAIHAQFPGKMLAYNCSPSRSTGRRTWTTRPSPSSSASSARWATSSSS